MEETFVVTKVQKLPLSDTTGGNWAIAPPEVFQNMFGVRYSKKLQPFCPSPLKISTDCGPMCGNGWIIERNVLSQSSWCALLHDSIRWKDWSSQWLPVTLASSIDFICSLTWQGTHENLWPLGLSVLSFYWHRHQCSQYLCKIGR